MQKNSNAINIDSKQFECPRALHVKHWNMQMTEPTIISYCFTPIYNICIIMLLNSNKISIFIQWE